LPCAIILIYIIDIYQGLAAMPDHPTAKLFMHGRSQAVRLPKEFRLPGTEVGVRRVGRAVLLEPRERDGGHIRTVFAALDRLGARDFQPERRPAQPPLPPARKVLDE
jgi:antitoxin VapB